MAATVAQPGVVVSAWPVAAVATAVTVDQADRVAALVPAAMAPQSN
jgi:hypothetical protein